MNLKRMGREFRQNLPKNISFILLIALSVMIIVGFNRAMDSYIAEVYRFYQNNHLEDGEFRIYGSLTKKQELSMEKRFYLDIEEYKSIDYDLDKTQKAKKLSKKERILRTISIDKAINQLTLLEGKKPTKSSEVVLDPKFAAANHYAIGDELVIYDNTFHIVGYGITPDYVYTLKNPGDFLNSPQTFGTAYVTTEGFEKVNNSEAKTSLYSYKIKENGNISHLKDYLEDHTVLLDFMEQNDNGRVKTIIDDANGPKQISTLMGILLAAIIAFMISISIKNNIQSESQTIGILYAQGFNNKELLRYYMLLPALLTLLGIILGYGGGILLSRPLTLMEKDQYTIPYVTLTDSWYLIIIGALLPMLVTLSITFLSLSASLNQTPLSLLRGNHSNNKISRIEKRFTFKGFDFFTRFRLKDIIRERGSMIALLLGSLLAMTILCTGLYIKDSCFHFVADLEKNVPFQYLYTFVDSKDLNKYSKKGELAVLKNVKMDFKETKKSLTAQGISPKSSVYKLLFVRELKGHEVLASPGLLAKFNLHIGDQLTLTDDSKNKNYTVVIKGIAAYDYGQYLYTNIKTFNHIFRIRKESCNALLTEQPLEVKQAKLSTVINKQQMINGVTNLLNMISIMSNILILVSAGILIIVIYMLMKMIIDKGKINISMVKIFGYTPDEVSRLYLRGNFVILVIGFMFSLPAGYGITKMLYDSIMMNMQQYIPPYIAPLSVFLAFIIMSLSYLSSCFLLKKNLDKVLLTEALKNRE